MNEDTYIMLPGLEKQLQFLIENTEPAGKKILVVGASAEIIAKKLYLYAGIEVDMIVEEYDSLINARIMLDKAAGVNVKLMEFDLTDYKTNQFDLIFAQASISSFKRKNIVKEFKRILKDDGTICIGELITLSDEYPQFVEDIFESTGIVALTINGITKFYESNKLEILARKDLSTTLKKYYSRNLKMLKDSLPDLNENEKTYYKKLITRISHESNSFLTHGGDKYIGFEALLMKKQ